MALDIAYTILVYENSKEEWKEEIMIKAQDKKDEEKKKAERRQNPKYHEGRGTDLKRYGNGWTEEGRKYYQELLKTFQDLKSSVFWDVSLQGYWNKYQIKHYGRTRVSESVTTTQNQTSMRMTMNLKKTGRWKLTNLKVTLTQVT